MIKVKIDENFCKGCELCVFLCPKLILVLDKEKVNISGCNPVKVIDTEQCIGCLNCAKMCPEAAITIEKAD